MAVVAAVVTLFSSLKASTYSISFVTTGFMGIKILELNFLAKVPILVLSILVPALKITFPLFSSGNSLNKI